MVGLGTVLRVGGLWPQAGPAGVPPIDYMIDPEIFFPPKTRRYRDTTNRCRAGQFFQWFHGIIICWPHGLMASWLKCGPHRRSYSRAESARRFQRGLRNCSTSRVNPHERFSILRELIGPIMVPNAGSSNCESKRELLGGLG